MLAKTRSFSLSSLGKKVSRRNALSFWKGGGYIPRSCVSAHGREQTASCPRLSPSPAAADAGGCWGGEGSPCTAACSPRCPQPPAVIWPFPVPLRLSFCREDFPSWGLRLLLSPPGNRPAVLCPQCQRRVWGCWAKLAVVPK